MSTDHLQRPVGMTDDNGDAVWQASYLPFGAVASITGSEVLNYRLPGQWFQLEAGLAYNWHRHYDATTGRYVSPDPLGMPDGPSRYAYVTNSPLMKVDPEGLQTTPPPPSNIPGGPWRWAENPGDGRQGRWHGQNGASGNWDSKGQHWDIDDGNGNRTRYNRHGSPMSAQDAHDSYKGPPRRPFLRWPKSGPILILPPAPPGFWCIIDPGDPSCCET